VPGLDRPDGLPRADGDERDRARERLARKRISIPARRVTTVTLKLDRSAYRRHLRQRSMSARVQLPIRRADGDMQRTARRVRVVAPPTT
jgi:hypothetical protein